MARHNREGRGSDQRNFEYRVSYQPDWLRLIKVTRTLESGRQSTKTLFRNPGERERDPGSKIRTRIVSEEQGLDFEVVLNDSRSLIRRVTVETEAPGVAGEEGRVTFILQDGRFTEESG